MLDIVTTSLELGLILSLTVLSVYITFRILHFPDLTVDGSYVTGAAATALAIKSGVPGLAALLFGFAAGFLAGSITAFLHTRLNIGKILSGILALAMLYTINLRIMGGPNISLLTAKNIIPYLKTPLNHAATIIFLLVVVVLVKFFIDWFLRTEFGLILRATGENEATAKSFGGNVNRVKFIGLGISNALAGLCGGMIAQYQGFVDINMGIGIIILGLACLMLGEAILKQKTIMRATLAVIIGTILYEGIINVSLRMGLAGTDLKFVTALIVVISLVVSSSQKKFLYAR